MGVRYISSLKWGNLSWTSSETFIENEMSSSFAGCQYQIYFDWLWAAKYRLHKSCFVSSIQFCESDLSKILLQSPICFCESNLLIFTRSALRNRADCLHVRHTFFRPSYKTVKVGYQPFCLVKKVSHPKDMKYASMQHNSRTSILMNPKLTVFMFIRRDPLAMTKSLKVWGYFFLKSSFHFLSKPGRIR